MRRERQQNSRQGQHAHAGDGSEQHSPKDTAKKDQDPHGVAKQGCGTGQEI
ncbi:hypothetical protein N9H39_02430 [Gammaproteobacteria bacterium]|nr:hypothetical protein [Gammaproteobacteria bacterium]